MAEPITMQKLIDASLDSDSLEVLVNGDENAQVVTRTGQTYPSAKKSLRLMTEIGIGFTAFETKALMTASAKPDGTYAVVTNDTVTNLGVYLKKSGAWTLTPWNNFTNLDSLKINSGKAYPLVNRKRNNITSIASSAMNLVLLDVTILNADPAYYYRVSYYSNGDTTYTTDGSSWVIEKILKADFAAQNNPIISLTLISQKQPVILKNTGIQKIELQTTIGQRFQEKIFVTVDSNALPASPLKINSPTADGYSYVVDDSCVFTGIDYDKIENPLLKYEGQSYPFIKKTFLGTTSAADDDWLNAVLDAKVINAEQGFLYTLAYYTNGSTILGAEQTERWAILKRPESTYDTETYIVATAMPQPTLKRGGVQTIALNSDGNERFMFVINTDKLPAYGTYLRNNKNTNKGYSWAINPATYLPASARYNSDGGSSTGCYIIYDAGLKRISYRYVSNGVNMEYVFGPNGANNLPNFISISKSSDGKSLSDTSMTVVQSTGTDWLPPLMFYATSGDPSASKDDFTGGNHLIGAEKTGFNKLYQIIVDSALLDMSKNFAGYVDSVSLIISNDLYASNTVAAKTVAMRQNFNVNFSGENIAVSCENKALVSLYLQIDYGAQMTSIGYQGTQLFIGGSQLTRATFDNTKDSGSRSAYPDAWAVALRSDNGTLMSYMQRGYGIALPTNTLADKPLIKGGSGSNTKFYQSAWFSWSGTESQHKNMIANESYKWRGGYVIQAPMAVVDFDTFAMLNDNAVIIKNGQDYINL